MLLIAVQNFDYIKKKGKKEEEECIWRKIQLVSCLTRK